jgi:hypothetical protein
VIQNEQELEVTRQRIRAFQDALLGCAGTNRRAITRKSLRTFSTKSRRWRKKYTNICSAFPNLNTPLLRNLHCLLPYAV